MDRYDFALPFTLVFTIYIQIAESGRSRIPVYRETTDHIIGVLLVKSLLPRLLATHEETVIDDLVFSPHFLFLLYFLTVH